MTDTPTPTPAPSPTTRYLMKTCSRRGDSESTVIEIPSDWKLTFSAVNPTTQTHNGDAHCVRIYEMPGSKLRAVFDSVSSIRDLSIPLSRQIRTEMGSAAWTKDSMGNFKENTEVKVDFELLPGEAF